MSRDPQVSKALPPILDERDSALGNQGRMPSMNRLALEGYFPSRDLALLERQHAGDRLEQRRLAGSIWAEQGDDAAFTHLHVDMLQRRDGTVIANGNIGNAEHIRPAFSARRTNLQLPQIHRS